MRKKGFTLVELLVVIAIIALLMGILMPALARVRQIAYRMICGTNLSGIGKAILLYAGDNKEEFPIAGPRGTRWATAGKVGNWAGTNQGEIYGEANPLATIGSSFYLLVKYADVTVKQYVCKGDVGTKIMKLTDPSAKPPPGYTIEDFTKGWDFGNKPGIFSSYSYHMPYFRSTNADPGFPISTNSDPASPVAADRNPFLDINAKYLDNTGMPTETTPAPGAQTPCVHWTETTVADYRDPEKVFNAAPHQRDGQNVLYADASVKFERFANVGIDKDNIWGVWKTITGVKPPKQEREACSTFPSHDKVPASGASIQTTGIWPMATDDAILVNEPQNTGQ
jgi:prepilin-type N-terminal cleavage/methylation domain-containing protein